MNSVGQKMTGLAASRTVMMKVQLAVLGVVGRLSLAVHITVVFPTANAVVAAGVHDSEEIPLSSEAFTGGLNTTPEYVAVTLFMVVYVAELGHEMVGILVSAMVMVQVQVLVLPEASVAAHV